MISLILERNFVKLSRGVSVGIVLQDNSHTQVQDVTGEWAKAWMIKKN